MSNYLLTAFVKYSVIDSLFLTIINNYSTNMSTKIRKSVTQLLVRIICFVEYNLVNVAILGKHAVTLDLLKMEY